mgnify:CR=1 FL=1
MTLAHLATRAARVLDVANPETDRHGIDGPIGCGNPRRIAAHQPDSAVKLTLTELPQADPQHRAGEVDADARDAAPVDRCAAAAIARSAVPVHRSRTRLPPGQLRATESRAGATSWSMPALSRWLRKS